MGDSYAGGSGFLLVLDAVNVAATVAERDEHFDADVKKYLTKIEQVELLKASSFICKTGSTFLIPSFHFACFVGLDPRSDKDVKKWKRQPVKQRSALPWFSYVVVPAIVQKQTLNALAHVVAENMAWLGRGLYKMSKACWKTTAEKFLKWNQGTDANLATK